MGGIRGVVPALAAVALVGMGQDRAGKGLPKCPPDWKVEVFAEVPRILHPSVICAAPDGRIFVGEDPMDMGEPADQPRDRIVCFHPNGQVTVFARGLYAVFGLQYIDGKLYVHHPPKFSVFTDDNGVGKDRVDIIECMNPNPSSGGALNDHIPSNFRLAMDGYFYISVGDKGIYGFVGRDGRRISLQGGGILRMRPDGTEAEVYCTGTRNHLDIAMHADDEMFTYDNTDDGRGWWTRLTHMVDGGWYGYPWDYKPRRPYTLWMITDYGAGSGVGHLAYTEDALPAEYHDNLFACDWTRSEIMRIELERQGATFRVKRKVTFLGPGPGDFRPLGITVSPDGMSLLVTDWNFPGWKQNVKAGRIFKVTYVGKSHAAPKPVWFVPAAMGKPFEAEDEDLIAGLQHPAKSVRMVAQRRLVDRKATAALKALLKNAHAPAYGRWHAIWALDALGERGGEILAALKDRNPTVRAQAARQLGTRRVKEALEPLTAMLKETDAVLRFQAATALGRIGSPEAVPGLLETLKDDDPWVRYAAWTALRRIGAWRETVRGLESRETREGTLFAMRDVYDERLVEALRGLLASSASAEAREAAVATLAELHRKVPEWNGVWWNVGPASMPPPAKTEAWAGTGAVSEALRAALKDPSPLVRRAAAAGLRGDPAGAAALRDLFRQEQDVQVRRAILRTLGALKDPEAVGIIAAICKAREGALLAEALDAAAGIGGKEVGQAVMGLVGEDLDATLLRKAIDTVGSLRIPEATAVLARRLTHQDEKVVQAAIAALAEIGGDAAVSALAPLLEDRSLETRRTAVSALGALKSKAAVPRLLQAYLDDELRFEAMLALAQIPDVRAIEAYLDGLGSKNSILRDRCRKAIGSIAGEALGPIESKLKSNQLAPDVIVELQRLYGGFQPVRDWWLLGPFANPCEEPFDVAAVPRDRELKGLRGGVVRWKKARTLHPDGHVNLCEQITAEQNVTAYAVAEIVSPEERAVEFMLGSDDGLTLWLNGRKIFEDLNDRAWARDQFRARGTLRAGTNVLVAKVGQHSGDWGFSVGLSMPKSGPLFEAKVRRLEPADYERFAMGNRGDAEKGRRMVKDHKTLACIKCHRFEGEGGDVGPDLSSIGRKFTREQLIEAVLYPSRQILDGYRQTILVTKDGIYKTGMVRAETAEEVTLVDSGGNSEKIRKADIAERKLSEVSIMPEGLNAGLTLAEFADLIAYLESLGK